jgi:signal transduction histidine kinase
LAATLRLISRGEQIAGWIRDFADRSFGADIVKDKTDKPTLQRLLLPTVSILVVACLVLAVVLSQALRQLDDTTRQASARAVNAIVGHEQELLLILAYDYSWWDQAQTSLVTRPDPLWAEDNIGSYLADTFNLSGSFVVAPDGATTFAFLDGEASEVEVGEILGPDVDVLVARARQAPGDEPSPVSAFVTADDGLLLVAASAITSEQISSSETEGMPRGVLVLAQEFPNDHVVRFADLAGAMGVSLQVAPPSDEQLAFPLPGVDGNPLGYLIWSSDLPGAALLEQIAVPIVIALLAIMGLVLIAFRNVAAVLAHEERLQNLLQVEQEFGDLQSRFIAMSSHRLRTPLSVIQAAAELISRYQNRMSAQDVVREADAIIRSVGELDAMIVETAKLERNQPETESVPTRHVCIEKLVSEIWDRRENRPSLEVSGSAMAHCDERRLRTVLTSILENAAKFSDEKGAVKVSIETDGHGIVVRVMDHGIGIAEQEIGQLGIPFVRASNAESVPGNGIGLAVARHTLNWMGGSLEVQSELHKGTTVTVRLPVGEEKPIAGTVEQH